MNSKNMSHSLFTRNWRRVTVGVVSGLLFAALSTTQAYAQGRVEKYEIRWADGYSVPIDALVDYVAVDVDFDRASAAMRRETKDLRPMSVGVAGRRISIARADNEDERRRFLSAVRNEAGNYLGVPIRAEARAEAPIVGVLTSEIVVRFSDCLSEKEIDSINERFGGVRIRRGDKPFENRYVLASQDGTPRSAMQLAARYQEHDDVVYVHPNLLVEKVSRNNDPLLGDQWHLNNTGQNNGQPNADANVVDAWQTTKGDGVTIAVIDPHGVERNHEDLIANRFENPLEAQNPADGVDNDGNGFRDDWSGWNFDQNTNNPTTSRPHGTAAAGVAAAACNNGMGGCGAAPEATILSIAQGFEAEDDARAFQYAVAMGADIISNSWGYPLGSLQRPTDAVEEAIAFAAENGRDGKGTVIVFAMTNEKIDNFAGPNPDISSLESVIAVGRSTNLDRWGESGFGTGMELLAPTQAAVADEDFGCLPDELKGTLDITTTDLMDSAGYNRGTPRGCSCNDSLDEIHATPNYTACFGGTSSATPLVAGVAALVLSVNPDLTRQQVYDILIDSAEKIDTFDARYETDSQGRLYSSTHGFGRINAVRAVELAEATLNPTTPAAPSSLDVSND